MERNAGLAEVTIEWFRECYEGHINDILLNYLVDKVIQPFFQRDRERLTFNYMQEVTSEFRKEFKSHQSRYALRAAFALIQFTVSQTGSITVDQFTAKYKQEAFQNESPDSLGRLCGFRNYVVAAMNTVRSCALKKEMFLHIACRLTQRRLYTMGSGQNEMTSLREIIIETETGFHQQQRKKRSGLHVLAATASKRQRL